MRPRRREDAVIPEQLIILLAPNAWRISRPCRLGPRREPHAPVDGSPDRIARADSAGRCVTPSPASRAPHARRRLRRSAERHGDTLGASRRWEVLSRHATSSGAPRCRFRRFEPDAEYRVPARASSGHDASSAIRSPSRRCALIAARRRLRRPAGGAGPHTSVAGGSRNPIDTRPMAPSARRPMSHWRRRTSAPSEDVPRKFDRRGRLRLSRARQVIPAAAHWQRSRYRHHRTGSRARSGVDVGCGRATSSRRWRRARSTSCRTSSGSRVTRRPAGLRLRLHAPACRRCSPCCARRSSSTSRWCRR